MRCANGLWEMRRNSAGESAAAVLLSSLIALNSFPQSFFFPSCVSSRNSQTFVSVYRICDGFCLFFLHRLQRRKMGTKQSPCCYLVEKPISHSKGASEIFFGVPPSFSTFAPLADFCAAYKTRLAHAPWPSTFLSPCALSTLICMTTTALAVVR